MAKVIMKDIRKPDYYYAEAIKTLRTNLQFSGKNIKSILFTSCYPNEGKSDVTFSLAQEMGGIGKRVPRVYLEGGRIVGTKDYFDDCFLDF